MTLKPKDMREADASFCRRRADRFRLRAKTIEGDDEVANLKRRYFEAHAEIHEVSARLHLAKGPGMRDGDKTFSELLEERAGLHGKCSAIVMKLEHRGIVVRQLFGSFEEPS